MNKTLEDWKQKFEHWLIHNLQFTSKSNVQLIIDHVERYIVPAASQELVDDEICRMIKEYPVKMISFMVSQMGKEAVAVNAETMDFSQESNIGDDRYKISCHIKMIKLGTAIPQTP